MLYKIVIAGKTPQELRANIFEYLGITELQHEADKDQADFLTHAAAKTQGSTSVSASHAEKPPTPAPAPVAAAAEATGVDSKGLPWDQRIHAATGDKNKDGSWRRRRGVEDRDVYAVEQELIARIKSGATEALHSPNAPPIRMAPVAAPPPLAVVPPLPVVTPKAPPVEPLPHAHTLETFRKTLIPLLAKLTRDGKITAEWVQTLKKHLDVEEIYSLNDEQLEWLFNYFVEYKLIEKV